MAGAVSRSCLNCHILSALSPETLRDLRIPGVVYDCQEVRPGAISNLEADLARLDSDELVQRARGLLGKVFESSQLLPKDTFRYSDCRHSVLAARVSDELNQLCKEQGEDPPAELMDKLGACKSLELDAQKLKEQISPFEGEGFHAGVSGVAEFATSVLPQLNELENQAIMENRPDLLEQIDMLKAWSSALEMEADEIQEQCSQFEDDDLHAGFDPDKPSCSYTPQ